MEQTDEQKRAEYNQLIEEIKKVGLTSLSPEKQHKYSRLKIECNKHIPVNTRVPAYRQGSLATQIQSQSDNKESAPPPPNPPIPPGKFREGVTYDEWGNPINEMVGKDSDMFPGNEPKEEPKN